MRKGNKQVSDNFPVRNQKTFQLHVNSQSTISALIVKQNRKHNSVSKPIENKPFSTGGPKNGHLMDDLHGSSSCKELQVQRLRLAIKAQWKSNSSDTYIFASAHHFLCFRTNLHVLYIFERLASDTFRVLPKLWYEVVLLVLGNGTRRYRVPG